MVAAESKQNPRSSTVRAGSADSIRVHEATLGVGLNKSRFIPYPTHDGVGALAYDVQITGRPSQLRAREVLAWTTAIYEQARVDLYHLRMLNRWRQQSPFVSRISELAAGRDQIPGEHEVPLGLPPNELLEKTCTHLMEAMAISRAAATTPLFNDDYIDQQTENAIRWAGMAAGVWYEQHQHIADYQRRTGQGGERVAETAKAAYLLIVAATTGFTAGGAFGIGAGTLRSLAATTATTATATGTAAGALTAAEQLHVGTFDPGAIARTALVETASTFAMGMVGGGLAQVFMKALSSHVLSTALAAGKSAPLYRAAMIHHDALVGNLIGVLAGGGAGALIGCIEAVLRAQSGHQLGEGEFTRLVLEQLAVAGVYQLAIAIAIRRTNSRFTDQGKPLHPILMEPPPEGQWDLQRIGSSKQNVDVLTAPRNLDHNGALYDDLGISKEAQAVYRALTNPGSKHGYLPNSLVINTHGSTTKLLPGNENVANIAADVLILRASQGDPRSEVLLVSCYQADAYGPRGASNAMAFQTALHKSLANKGYDETFPEVHTSPEPGTTTSKTFSNIEAPRPAMHGGIRTPAWHEAEKLRHEAKRDRVALLLATSVAYSTIGTAIYQISTRPELLQKLLKDSGIGSLDHVRQTATDHVRAAIARVLATRPDLMRAVLNAIGIGGPDGGGDHPHVVAPGTPDSPELYRNDEHRFVE